MQTASISVLPISHPEYEAAIASSGARFMDLGAETTGLVWTDSQDVRGLSELLHSHHGIRWVQLPFAGVDNFQTVFAEAVRSGREIVFTSAKGAYREPVAEHALMLALSLARALPERINAKSWGRKFAVSLYDSNVLIIGGGGIAHELARLLQPFRANVTALKRHVQQVDYVQGVATLAELDEVLPKADFVFVASALTSETKGIFNQHRFSLMKPSSYFINIARGPIVVTQDLIEALEKGSIAGAGLDVTDPEPLPDGHALWSAPNVIITPHTADTPEMCVTLLSERIVENGLRFASGQELVGIVDLTLGY